MGIAVKAIDLNDMNADLHLFDDDTWDFFSEPVDDLNTEYFCEETKFLDKNLKLRLYFPYILLMVIVAFVGYLFVHFIINKPDTAYNNYMTMLDSGVSQYIEGTEASSECYIEISQIMQEYCDVLSMQKNYKQLDAYCTTTSTFRETYDDNKRLTQQSFDAHDNYTRAMRYFTKGLHCNKVDKVIEKDGVYYAYIHLSQPTKGSVREYVNLHKYNAVKEFNGLAITENDLSTFLLDTMETNPIMMEDSVICLEFVNKGKMRLISDSDVVNIVTTAYSYAVSQLSHMISSSVSMK